MMSQLPLIFFNPLDRRKHFISLLLRVKCLPRGGFVVDFRCPPPMSRLLRAFVHLLLFCLTRCLEICLPVLSTSNLTHCPCCAQKMANQHFKTPITEMFKIQHPIILAGMNVAAVCTTRTHTDACTHIYAHPCLRYSGPESFLCFACMCCYFPGLKVLTSFAALHLGFHLLFIFW
jgi:ABC-type maltose transport system permease subunit